MSATLILAAISPVPVAIVSQSLVQGQGSLPFTAGNAVVVRS